MFSQLGKDYEFLYTYDHKGHLCVEGTPASEAEPGKIWVWETTLHPVSDIKFGSKGTGKWVKKEDHRKDTLYSEQGQYSVGSDLEGQSYNGFGAIPSWLTDVEKPSQFHHLVNGVWVENIEEKEASEKAQERSWRDNEINSIEWIKQRHRDEIEQGITTTISVVDYQSLISYIQELRDWPEDINFPNSEHRPVAPEFIALQ